MMDTIDSILQNPFSLDILDDTNWMYYSLGDLANHVEKKDFFNKMSVSGIYIFWWSGSEGELNSLHRKQLIKGKNLGKDSAAIDDGHALHRIILNVDWLLSKEVGDQLLFPLYVGKSTNIRKRLSQHIRSKSRHEDWRTNMYEGKRWEDYFSLYSPTTSCQFRSGMELLYHQLDEAEFWNMLNTKIYFSYFNLHDPSNPDRFIAERFYLEDYLIGTLRPWFNLDSER